MVNCVVRGTLLLSFDCFYPNMIRVTNFEQIYYSFAIESKIMALKINFTSLKNFVFFYISFRLFTEGLEEFLIQPTAWYYIKFLGESDVFLGLTLAGYSAGALLFAPFVGVLELKFDASKLLTVMCASVRFVGNLLYSIPINGYFPLVGRFVCGLGAGTEGILFGVITKGTTSKNRAKAFLYLDGLYCLGTTCGPIFGSVLTFKMDIFGWRINPGNFPLTVARWSMQDQSRSGYSQTSLVCPTVKRTSPFQFNGDERYVVINMPTLFKVRQILPLDTHVLPPDTRVHVARHSREAIKSKIILI